MAKIYWERIAEQFSVLHFNLHNSFKIIIPILQREKLRCRVQASSSNLQAVELGFELRQQRDSRALTLQHLYDPGWATKTVFSR